MKTSRLRFGAILPVTVLLFASAHSQAVIAYLGGNYSDTLDELGIAPSTWANDATGPGWFAYRDGSDQVAISSSIWVPISVPPNNYYQTSTGQGFPGKLLNFGTSDSSANRALGANPSSTSYTFALVLRNDTGTALTDFTLSYYGEQWHKDGLNSLSFSYGVFSDFADQTIAPNGGNGGNFYAGYSVPAGNALDFSPFVFTNSGGSSTPLDGTDPANRQLRSATQSVNWLAGQYLVLRWLAAQPGVGGNVSSMLAVDDVIVTTTPTPEPASAALLALGALLLGARRKRPALAA